MKFTEAQQFIGRSFNRFSFNETEIDAVNEDTFLEVLEAIENHIPFKSRRQNEHLARFLWAGCRRFNRWFAPSPYVVPRYSQDLHRRFTSAFHRTEGFQPVNVSVFEIHVVKDQIYETFNELQIPFDTNETHKLQELESVLKTVPAPRSQAKLGEFTNEKQGVVELLRALGDGDLRTHIRFTMPYPLTRSPLIFRSVWGGIEIQGTLSPTFLKPAELMVNMAPPAVIVASNPTRWQFGTTVVELQFAALIDPSIQVAPLQLPMEPPPVPGWPNGFRVAFQTIYELCWRLKGRHEFLGTWIPSPSDVGDVAIWHATKNNPQIGLIRKGNPAIFYTGFFPQPGPSETVVDLGEVAPSPWHVRCRILAQQYLSAGETREALFWINVAAESLIHERIASLTGPAKPLSEADLKGAPTFWDEAKELVAAKFPDIVNQIEWPNPTRHPSLFQRLSFVTKRVDFGVPARTLLGHYSKIQRDRNAIFHGVDEASPEAERVKTAIDSFDWLAEHFVPRSSPST